MPSSNHFQCNRVSFQLQTGQVKRSPAALPGDLSLTHQTPFRCLFSHRVGCQVQKRHSSLAWTGEGQGEREGVRYILGKPGTPVSVLSCVHKRPALQSTTWFFQRPNFSLAVDVELGKEPVFSLSNMVSLESISRMEMWALQCQLEGEPCTGQPHTDGAAEIPACLSNPHSSFTESQMTNGTQVLILFHKQFCSIYPLRANFCLINHLAPKQFLGHYISLHDQVCFIFY